MFGIRSGTEEPKYTVLDRLGPGGQVQIRQYAPRLAASVTLKTGEIDARYQGFRRLAGYIFGKNTTNTSIAMTAPVAQSENIAMTAPVAQTAGPSGAWTISFYMPASFTLATLPKPLDPGIHLHEVPAATLAVLRFSGIPGSQAVATAEQKLLGILEGTVWVPAGPPVAWFYDPPWTLPWARRNEVAVPVAAQSTRLEGP